MKITVSFTLSEILCRVRKTKVESLPEEHVRQGILDLMIDQLGFPLSHLIVEQSLKQMPHLVLPLPDRRIDIACFAKGIHPKHELFPLLLIECKAVPITPQVIRQVVSYNHHMQAYFIAVASPLEIRTGWFDSAKGEYQFIPFLPTYKELLSSLY